MKSHKESIQSSKHLQKSSFDSHFYESYYSTELRHIFLFDRVKRESRIVPNKFLFPILISVNFFIGQNRDAWEWIPGDRWSREGPAVSGEAYREMSTEDGIDNPAFASDDCATESRLNDEQQQATLDHKSEGGPVENGHQRAQFVSQQYVEPGKTSPDPHHQRTETKIELPDANDKTVVEPKMNGVHGNGNNNDASFLNNSATNVQINGEWRIFHSISF